MGKQHAGWNKQQIKHPQQPEIHVCSSQFVSLNTGVCKVSFSIQFSSTCFWLGIPALTTCFLQRFSTEIIAKYFKALDMENIFLTLHHYTFFERGNEHSVSIIGLTYTLGNRPTIFICVFQDQYHLFSYKFRDAECIVFLLL